MTKLLWITTTNEIEIFESKSLEDLQEKVGGYIEIVWPQGLPDYNLIVNEEGLLEGMLFNLCGSFWYGYFEHGQPIVGDIIVSKQRDDGEIGGLTEQDIKIITDEVEKIKKQYNK